MSEFQPIEDKEILEENVTNALKDRRLLGDRSIYPIVSVSDFLIFMQELGVAEVFIWRANHGYLGPCHYFCRLQHCLKYRRESGTLKSKR